MVPDGRDLPEKEMEHSKTVDRNSDQGHRDTGDLETLVGLGLAVLLASLGAVMLFTLL